MKIFLLVIEIKKLYDPKRANAIRSIVRGRFKIIYKIITMGLSRNTIG